MSDATSNARVAENDKSDNVLDQLSANYGEECEHQQEDFQLLMDDVGQAVTQYCRRRPGVAAMTIFAVGFFLGWKIKPW